MKKDNIILALCMALFLVICGVIIYSVCDDVIEVEYEIELVNEHIIYIRDTDEYKLHVLTSLDDIPEFIENDNQ